MTLRVDSVNCDDAGPQGMGVRHGSCSLPTLTSVYLNSIAGKERRAQRALNQGSCSVGGGIVTTLAGISTQVVRGAPLNIA